MAVHYSSHSIVRWLCVNCGEILIGKKNRSGNYTAECPLCHAVMVRKIKSRRTDFFEVHAPEGMEHVFQGQLY